MWGRPEIAEGVETGEELSCLIELACRYAQGYLLGKPISRDAFELLLERGRIEVPRPHAA